jgi:hypothetical protein
MLKPYLVFLTLMLVLGGCREEQAESGRRNVDTPLKSLRGHWRDSRHWGWEEFFGKDGRSAITVNKETFYGGSYRVTKQDVAQRSLEVMLIDNQRAVLRIGGHSQMSSPFSQAKWPRKRERSNTARRVRFFGDTSMIGKSPERVIALWNNSPG